MTEHPSTDPVVLQLGQSADPDACGSCKFFQRHEWNSNSTGDCKITMPPYLVRKDWDGEGKPPNLVDDKCGCSLHVHTGKTYVVQTMVRPK